MASIRRTMLVGLVLVIGMAFILPTNTMAAAKPEIVWKVQSSWPAGSGLHYLQVRTLDFIEHWTHGRVKFERYAADEIVPGYETWNAVQRGIFPVGLACTCYTMSRDWISGMYCASPGLGPVEKMAFYHGTKGVRESKNYETPVWKLLEKNMREKFNVQVFPSAMQTTETFLYSAKPINSIEDLKKLKIRTVGVRGDIFNAAGASVVGMPAGEIMPALERGVIDAAEFANFFGDIPLGFADVAKYVYFDPFSATPSNLMLFINQQEWEKVPQDLQKLIKEATFESMKWSLAECLFLDFLTMVPAAKNHGAQILTIPAEVGEYIHETAMEFYRKKAETDSDLAEYMKYYDEFFIDEGYGEYIKYIKSLL